MSRLLGLRRGREQERGVKMRRDRRSSPSVWRCGSWVGCMYPADVPRDGESRWTPHVPGGEQGSEVEASGCSRAQHLPASCRSQSDSSRRGQQIAAAARALQAGGRLFEPGIAHRRVSASEAGASATARVDGHGPNRAVEASWKRAGSRRPGGGLFRHSTAAPFKERGQLSDDGHGAWYGRGYSGMDFRLLGPLEVIERDRPLALGGAKQRSLLAILLLQANELVSTDRLIDQLWGAAPPATCAKSIQIYVSRLRKQLGDERLATQAPGYVLQVEPSELDLARFERLADEARRGDPRTAARKLRDALALWRGSPLADLAYEPFAQPEIARLEELRMAVLEQRIDADLAVGRHAELVGELEALIVRQPAAGAAAVTAHARPLPLGAPGRGPQRLPCGSERALRGARARAERRVEASRAGDPAS